MEYYYPFKQYIFPQQHMMFANYQPSITYKFPFVPLDEVFVNIHNFLPEVKDCYYISNYGRVFNTSTNTFNSVHFNKDGYLMVSLAYDKNHKPENTVRKVRSTYTIRNNVTSHPKKLAIPAHTPANIFPLAGRVSFLFPFIIQI